MIKFRYFSTPVNRVISTGGGIAGFDRKRKYDTSTDRLLRSSYQNELNKGSRELNSELEKMRKELRGTI